MTTDRDRTAQGGAARVVNPGGAAPVVLVCEHATHLIPGSYGGLGLSDAARTSHAAWDPGALAVAEDLSRRLGAVLVAGVVSRLVYDLNRPPEAPDAMPALSEVIPVPGNEALSEAERADRVARYYTPFHGELARVLDARPGAVLVTVHSFTPVYYGTPREVEIGVLHHRDARLADALLATGAEHTQAVVRRNAPYGPEHGVMHTLERHGLAAGRLHVMLEIRNDLIATPADQQRMAAMLAGWIADSCVSLGMEDVSCAG